jgi:hypothetical protein
LFVWFWDGHFARWGEDVGLGWRKAVNHYSVLRLFDETVDREATGQIASGSSPIEFRESGRRWKLCCLCTSTASQLTSSRRFAEVRFGDWSELLIQRFLINYNLFRTLKPMDLLSIGLIGVVKWGWDLLITRDKSLTSDARRV